jgi:hypothetical protein
MRKRKITDLQQRRIDIASLYPDAVHKLHRAYASTSGGDQSTTDPRVFLRVYSYIVEHPGSVGSVALVDLLRAIYLDRSAFYFERLERLEPAARDLGLELLKAKLYGAFPLEKWEEAHRVATELDQRGAQSKGEIQAPHAAKIPDEEARAAGSNREDSAIAPSASMESNLSNFTRSDPQSGHAKEKNFRHRSRSTLAGIFARIGFNSFHLLGAAAAAAIVAFFLLVIFVDEGVPDRRLEALNSTPRLLESAPETSEPIPAPSDTIPAPSDTAAPAEASAAETPSNAAPTAEENTGVLLAGANDQLTTPPEPEEVANETVPIAAKPAAPEPAAVAPVAEDGELTSVPNDEEIVTAPALAEPSTEPTAASPAIGPAPPAAQEPIIEQEAPRTTGTGTSKPQQQRSVARKKAQDRPRAVARASSTPAAEQPALSNPAARTSERLEATKPIEPSTMPQETTRLADEQPAQATPAVNPAAESAPAAPLETTAPPSDRTQRQVEASQSPRPNKDVLYTRLVERLRELRTGERSPRIVPGRETNDPDLIKRLEGLGGTAPPLIGGQQAEHPEFLRRLQGAKSGSDGE